MGGAGEEVLENPLAAVQMGLIYVNPEGPGGSADALASAREIRETFQRMGMTDEETVALTAGGHTFGKSTRCGATPRRSEPSPRARTSLSRDWMESGFESGVGDDTITSGLEGAWTPNADAMGIQRWHMLL